MDIELRSKADLLSENYNEIRKSLRWDGELLNHFEALIYGRTDKEFSLEKIQEIRRYIKKEKKSEYPFKGNFHKIFSIMLSDSENYKEVFENTRRIYENLISRGFNENEKTAFSALILSQRFNDTELDKRVDRLIAIKNELGKTDYLSYANLAATNKDIKVINNEITIVKEKLKEAGLNVGIEAEGFATALIIENRDITEKIEKALNISCNIKTELFALPSKAFPLLGLATLLVEDSEAFSKELKEVYTILKGKKGYKYFMDNELRLIISLGVLLNKYTEEIKADLIDVNLTDEINVLLALEEYTVFSLASF
ncbi:DUF4003 family protein [Clostridium paraputrificum]|uniref:DUF4003 family protein n=1 Tax=Clostridium TaxID=1485 RepID=UPI003D335C77